MRISMLAAVAGALLAPIGAAAQSYNVVSNFGSSNFSYSYGSNDILTNNTPLKPSSNGCYDQGAKLSCYNVTGQNDQSLPLVARNVSGSVDNFLTVSVPTNELLLHPGSAATNQDAIVTFTATTAGLYTIDGAFTRLDTVTSNGVDNNGVFAEIYYTPLTGLALNGLLYSSGLTLSGAGIGYGTNALFNFTTNLSAGDRLSFVVANAGNYSNDSTGLRATITGAVPEPAGWAMMILGIGAIGFGLRRRERRSVSAVAVA